MDSDLAESLSALKAAFERRKLPARFGHADAVTVESLRKTLRIPARYRAFLLESDPVDVETVTPVEKVRLLPASELLAAQLGFALDAGGEPRAATRDGEWKKSWIIIGESGLLGDPYFLDVGRLDAEGDCPVMTAMNGAGRFEARVAASTFAQFLRILAAGMEVAQGYGEAILDDDDEAAFREALGAKIKTIDGGALRAGHWT